MSQTTTTTRTRRAVAPEPTKAATKEAADVEFGGPWGVFAIMVLSHVFVYGLYLEVDAGVTPVPSWWETTAEYFARISSGLASAAPNARGAKVFFGFLLGTSVLSCVCPGVEVRGLPLESLSGKTLTYVCNGTGVWYGTLATLVALHASGTLSLSVWIDELGSIFTWSVIVADVVAVALYVYCAATRTMETPQGNAVYDIFMGVSLNPRLTLVPGFPPLDLKMYTELRCSWILLAVYSVACAVKHHEEFGHVTAPLCFMVLAHFLYANACAKGDHCVPTTWDIFHEKWGWMLIFWNVSGVPLTYCTSSRFLLRYTERHGGEALTHSPAYTAALFALLLVAYYVFDTANSQKNHFRMQRAGTYLDRRSFPQLPWRTVAEPVRTLKTHVGSELFVDGWYRYVRKPHYTADIVQGLTWGLICGFSSFVPYWYVTFFLAMISHRATRDVQRCRKKYGADWDTYENLVPYTFIPYIL